MGGAHGAGPVAGCGVRVATFNIHHGTVGSSGPVDVERLAQVCAEFDADVIGLQEVDLLTERTGRKDLPGDVARALGMAHVFGPSTRHPGGWYGNALLVRGEIDTWTLDRLPRLPRWKVTQERRTLLRARVRTGGVSLAVGVTHLAVPRAIGLHQLRALVDLVVDDPRPLVVIGDLNRAPQDVAPLAGWAGLDVVDHERTHPVTKPKLRIDHVLHSPDLVVERVEVRSTPMSDHRALLVDLVPAPAP
jgi:endonuclease/exonuclease/phosphatase family metal-dependent hydrolase